MPLRSYYLEPYSSGGHLVNPPTGRLYTSALIGNVGSIYYCAHAHRREYIFFLSAHTIKYTTKPRKNQEKSFIGPPRLNLDSQALAFIDIGKNSIRN